MFRWAAQREYIQPDQLVSINTIQGEEKGRSKAKPARDVDAVPDDHVILTLPHLPETVADMVRLQRFTGMRPQEVCDIKFGDIQTINGDIYFYPKHHKTIHKGKIRAVPLNANVLSLLNNYKGTADEFIFSPKKSRERQIAIRTFKRVTPPSCGSKPKKDRIIKGGDHYTSCSYRRAIYRACDRLFFGINGYKWSPNQLRHAAAVEIDSEHGIEAVGAALGHSKIAISRRYAGQNLKLATKAVGRVGAAIVG